MTTSFSGDTGASAVAPGSVTSGSFATGAIAAADIAAGAITTVKLAADVRPIQSLTLGTAIATTSGTSHDFTGIPSWVKRITVMFNGVSLSGTSTAMIQLGSGSPATTGYNCRTSATGGSGSIFTTGFGLAGSTVAADLLYGACTLTLLSGNIWTFSTTAYNTSSASVGGGSITLAGVLDRVRLTTVNGTDTFDAGSVNIMYE